MAYNDLDNARDHYRGMRDLILNERSGWSEEQTLSVLRAFCERTRRLLNDEACNAHLDAVSDYAAATWSDAANRKWQQSHTSRSQFVRQQIVRELEGYAARLTALEKVRSTEETWRK